ncbi:Zn(II)2Cys6 transcription factor domain-containing protein [Aspergillus novofumigatus IBT 16806]|uniref:Zn(2)-C6 fungal-type domain-containing protein n=1 Tax=Aspergillus novofumigatus (strain IBT 16806) TaxID=1392255 RepID=A0A2I1BVS3_ASPN1|nr:uncharacterized protein P174DRAFT_445980 [Aspergillus novofumigatus IBT 16806]PKX89468.1 hypothetical protein P174DRAFT_445980 [Aspergillus novofumigatus IBT 16806]
MGRRSKQKSCFACAEAKRRCDKRQPSCSRCVEKGVDCAYPAASGPECPQARMTGAAAIPDVGFGDAWTSPVMNNTFGPIPQAEVPLDNVLFDSDFATSLISISSLSSAPSYGAFSSHPAAAGQLSASFGDLSWFLQPQAWTVPPPSVFSSFLRGLEDWLFRFVRDGHNPFIHRHLYSGTGFPQCLQDAYSAIAIWAVTSPENEHIVDQISSDLVSKLLEYQHTAGPMGFSFITTREHLVRTQSLLIHLLLALFSASINRRARAESLVNILRDWASQLWQSATHDATLAPPMLTVPSIAGDTNARDVDPVPRLYQAFVLSESIRRTWLLCSIATGVYGSLKGGWSETCGGDVHITTHTDLWAAPSSARWEAIARHTDPLFIYSLRGQTLVERGVRAAQVDEFARHLFTLMWGLEKVETWIVRTGDAVSITY